MLGDKMSWWKDVLARVAMHFSDFFSLIRGAASLDRVLSLGEPPMTWDHILSAQERASSTTKQVRLEEPPNASQRRRAITTRLSR